MADLNTRLKSQSSSAISRIILAKLQPWCCEVQFFPWSPVDFSLELSSATCVQSLGKFCRCLAMLSHAGHE